MPSRRCAAGTRATVGLRFNTSLAAVGGTGGSGHQALCPFNYVLSSIDTRSANVVDAVTGRCAYVGTR